MTEMTTMQIIVWLAFASCLGSFIWGMNRFFRMVGRVPPGFRVIQIAGAVSAIGHLITLSQANGISRLTGLLGLGFYCISLALFWSSIWVNREKPLSAAFYPDAPEHITIRGPYRYIRHPFYMSYLLAWSAGTIASGQSWLWLTVLAMVLIYYRAARMEERKFLVSRLGDEYVQYRHRSGMFIPRFMAKSSS
jgi:protein-S-isoprenylcysteine O-methyltransferase Ste14